LHLKEAVEMKELKYKSRIIKNADLRNQRFREGQLWFCSVLDSNLSGMCIETKGHFVGNGWKNCSFYGSSYTGLYSFMEIYEGCNMGCMDLRRARCRELAAEKCGFTGSCLRNSRIEECTFQSCSFKNVHLSGLDISHTVFLNCTFCGVTLEQVRLSETIFKKCTFEAEKGKLLDGCVFENCIFAC